MEPSKAPEKSKRPIPDPPQRPPRIGEWMKLRSKTYQGRPFYHNTVSGASVWNLSDAELAKSQKYENHEIREVSEPKDVAPVPPEPTMPLKRQITNDQVKKPIAPPSQPKPPANFTQTQPYAPYKEQQIIIPVPPPNPAIIPTFQPPQIMVPNYPPPPLQTPMLSYPPPPMMPYYPQPQMNVPNFTNQNFSIQKGPIDVGVLVQSTAVSMSSRFQTINVKNKLVMKAIEDSASTELEIAKQPPVIQLPEPELQTNLRVETPLRPPNVKPKHYKNFSRIPFVRPQRPLRNNRVKDLREILQAKKLKSNTKIVSFEINDNFNAQDSTPPIQENNECDIESQMTHLNVGDKASNTCDEDKQMNTNDDYDGPSDKPSTTTGGDVATYDIEDSQWLQKNTADKNKKSLYVKPLKVLLGCGDEDLWYVVADTNVFISNGYFLKTLVNSDDNCRILVSLRIVTELEGRLTQGGSEASQEAAFAAITFLGSSPKAITDEMLFTKMKVNVRFTTGDDQILDCVLRLSQHNFRVLFLSNDKVLNSKTKISNVPTFTVPELKDYLSSLKVTKEDKPEISKPIRITFNNSPQNSQSNIAKETVTEPPHTSTDILPVRNIADSGAQTDFSPKQILIEIPNTKTLVDKDVQTIDDHSEAENSDKKTKVNVKTATETEKVSRNCKRMKWWSRRRKRESNVNSVSTSTDTDTLHKLDNNSQPKTQSLQSCPLKNESTTQSNIAQSNTESEDSFTLSKRFSGSYHFSDSSQLQPKTVEASPTNSSDAISNTRSFTSPVNNGIEFSEDNCPGGVDGDIFVMTDKAIEERLKTCSEEWTSRFVQIMDEVLTQVLRQNPLLNNSYQPPWTVHEAAVCIREKYGNNSAIVNAATQFLFTVFASTDKMGNIFRTLSPDRFMKLFSHGWTFVDILHRVLSGRPGSEDLAVAKESLTKLLNDIKGLNSDTIDQFVDISADEYLKDASMNALETEQIVDNRGDIYQHYESPPRMLPILQNPNKDPLLTQASNDIRNINTNDEGLMKYINSYNATNQFDQDEFIQNIHRTPDHSPPPEELGEESFSLKTPETTSPINERPKITRNIKAYQDRSNNDNELGKCNMDMRSSQKTLPKNENLMVNKLIKFAEYKERLCKDSEKLDMDMLSYSDEEYEVQDEKYNNYGEVITGDDDLLEASDDYRVETKLDGDSELMIKTFLAEIKDTFIQVRSYCEQTYLELSNDQFVNPERKLELKEQTEDMHAFLNSLLSTLNSILLRENTSEVNIQQSRFANFKISDSQFTTYSDIIGKCSTQVNILLDVLNSIMREISVKC